MAISPDKVRELCSRREGTSLDFKLDTYDWPNDGNNELSKDLMAMANCLARDAPPAYILIGVKELPDGTGEIVGVPAGSHLNDASLQQKVADLNRRPVFSYSPVDVDGRSVGVFEIRPGQRPYYALREKGARHKLQRFAPLYRSGSSTDLASPDMVIEWAREDNAEVHELRQRELAKLDAEAVLRAKFTTSAVGGGGDAFSADGLLQNTGLSHFIVERIRVEVSWNERFEAALKSTPDGKVPDDYRPPSFEIEGLRGEVLKPGGTLEVRPRYTREQARQHFDDAGVVVAGFEGRWADYHVHVEAKGVLGGTLSEEFIIKT
jgi:hypothetical protein